MGKTSKRKRCRLGQIGDATLHDYHERALLALPTVDTCAVLALLSRSYLFAGYNIYPANVPCEYGTTFGSSLGTACSILRNHTAQ